MQSKLTLRAAAVAACCWLARAQETVYTITGDSSADQLGRSVTFLPDIDGDGYADFAVGAPFADPAGLGATPGSVKLFSGKTGALLREIVGDGQDSEFGHSIAGVPDVDGDGRYDLLIGAPSRSYAVTHQGAAYVYTSDTGLIVRVYFGASADEFLGTSVANLGDVDLDGVEDYAVGAPFADAGGYTDNGRVKVYSGASGALLRDFWQGVDYGQFGWSIASAGDTNGDGRSDYLISAPAMSSFNYNHNGTAYLFTGGGWAARVYSGSEDFEQFGWSLSKIGDVDGDYRSDFAIGSPWWDGAGTSRGRVRVYSGNQWLYDVEGMDGWRLGESIAPIGNVDGDGRADFAVGVPDYYVLNVGAVGAVRAYSGVDGDLNSIIVGNEAGSDFGVALASGRDLTGDQRSEFVIGAPSEDSHGANAGAARLVLGDSSAPNTYCTAKVNSLGCTPRIDFSGAPSQEIGDNFHITAHGVRSLTNGMLFWGFTPSTTPFHGGTLCVGQPLVRTAAQNSGLFGLGPNCSGTFDFHFSQAYMASHNLHGAMSIYAQFWSRDPGFATPNNIGLTNALHFEIQS